MPICQSCDAFVSADFVRVLGDNENTVSDCVNCTPVGEEYGRALSRPGT